MDLLYRIKNLAVDYHAFDRQMHKRTDRQKGDSKTMRCIRSRTVKTSPAILIVAAGLPIIFPITFDEHYITN